MCKFYTCDATGQSSILTLERSRTYHSVQKLLNISNHEHSRNALLQGVVYVHEPNAPAATKVVSTVELHSCRTSYTKLQKK